MSPTKQPQRNKLDTNGLFGDFDFATRNACIFSMGASLHFFEDNEAVIKMITIRRLRGGVRTFRIQGLVFFFFFCFLIFVFLLIFSIFCLFF